MGQQRGEGRRGGEGLERGSGGRTGEEGEERGRLGAAGLWVRVNGELQIIRVDKKVQLRVKTCGFTRNSNEARLVQVWVEPQHGVVTNSSQERKPFDGLTHAELAQAVSTVCVRVCVCVRCVRSPVGCVKCSNVV